MNKAAFRTWKRLRPIRRERGVALVELAIVLMVLVLIMLGIMQFGYVFYIHHNMVNAARDAARVAAVRDASAADAIGAAQNELGGLNLNFNIKVQIPTDPNAANRDVNVQISTPMSGLSFGLLGDGELRASVTMRKEASAV